MLVPFLIMLREGVEAALVVGIVASSADQASLHQAMDEFADRIAGLPAILGL